MRFRKALLALAGVLAVAFLFTASWAGNDNNPNRIAAPCGVTHHMTSEWWQWAIGIPTSVHPLRTDIDTKPNETDPSSAYCMVGQHGNYWFIGGAFSQVDIDPEPSISAASIGDGSVPPPDITRQCRIPLGATIVMPVLNAECNTAEEIYLGNLTEEDSFQKRKEYLKRCAREQADAITTAEAFLTGPWGNSRPLNVQRVRSPQGFPVTYAPDHILQFGTPWEPTVNPSLTFDDGYWVAFKPLQSGTYELNTFGDAPAFNFSLRIKYILEIVGTEAQ